MLLQVPHVLHVGAIAPPSRGGGPFFDLDDDGTRLKALDLTDVRCHPPCPWSEP